MKKNPDKNVTVKNQTVTEIKVCVMSFQLALSGVPHAEDTEVYPQSNNKSNNFIIDMESAPAQAM